MNGMRRKKHEGWNWFVGEMKKVIKANFRGKKVNSIANLQRK